MGPARLPDLPSSFATTRHELHRVAEHVLAPALHASTGRIGLRATAGNSTIEPMPFGPAPYPYDGHDRSVSVLGTTLVLEDAHDGTRALDLTTVSLAGAASFIDGPLGAPAGVYTPDTDLDPTDELLDLDPASADALGCWYAFGQAALEQFVASVCDRSASPIQLWPEHFDLATDLGDADQGTRANYGASPGDEAIADPYLYVGPWSPPSDDVFWNATTFPGAFLAYGQLQAADDSLALALEFLHRAHTLLTGASA